VSAGALTTCRRPSLRRGLSLVEMAISIVLVSVMLAAALNTVGASKLGQLKISVGRQGHLLAQDLMTEILLQDYADPVDGPDSFGLSGAEAATGDRSLFDDVDDYDGWSASPPQYKDGTVVSGLEGWERSVEVTWVNPSDISQLVGNNQGAKRITVTVTHNGIPAAELVALETIGLPPLEACCFSDGNCADLRVEACAADGGIPQGPDTNCISTECPSGAVVLLVVTDDSDPTAPELARQTLIESWDFSVELIAASADQSHFDDAVAGADVAYVSTEVLADELGTKLRYASIGVINENTYLIDEFGFSEGTLFTIVSDYISVVDNTHYITSAFEIGQVTILSSAQNLVIFGSLPALGAQFLAEIGNNNESLLIIEVGGLLTDGSPAPGRRVELPWGLDPFDFNSLNDDGETIMRQALEWAAGMDVGCGDEDCAAGENPCNCPDDCGDPAAFEQPGVTCDDGIDNDCDGDTDCDDINCGADPACQGTVCGNGVCESGEDCNSCVADCPGMSTGSPSGRYCCGNGVAESAEGDGSICDGNY